jgi:hypothetical protein
MTTVFVHVDNVDIPAVDAGGVTPLEGVSYKLTEGETLWLSVLEHPEPGPANLRVEVSRDGHREAQVYHGELPEGGSIDFSNHGNLVSVWHKGKE